MKKLPEVDVSFDELYRILIAPIRSKLLLTGIELGVFNQLSEPRSAEDIAEVIGTHPQNTKLFLNGLTASELVIEKNGLYQNTLVTQAYLVERSSTFMGQTFNFWSKSFILNNLSKLVKEGPPDSSGPDMESEERWAQAAIFTVNYERAGVAQQAVEIISKLPEFPSFRKMLDLGGGPGLIGIAIVVAHPNMEGIIFDRPAVVKIAEACIKEYELDDRMDVMGGDYFRDSIGEGYDLIWTSTALNFCKNDVDSVMKKIYDALNPGGIFISYAEGLTHERTRPNIMVLSMMSMALMDKDMYFDKGFIADSMFQVGFKSIGSRTLETPIGPMDLDIGRKAK